MPLDHPQYGFPQATSSLGLSLLCAEIMSSRFRFVGRTRELCLNPRRKAYLREKGPLRVGTGEEEETPAPLPEGKGKEYPRPSMPD